MKDHVLRNLVTVAVSLDRQIAVMQDQLKLYKEQLATEAETRSDEATPTEGGGSSISFEGADGCVARVTVAGPTLKSSIKPGDKKLPKIKELAGRGFSSLFETEIHFKPAANFRDAAADLLGEPAGARLVKLCETSGKTTVSFETKEGS